MPGSNRQPVQPRGTTPTDAKLLLSSTLKRTPSGLLSFPLSKSSDEETKKAQSDDRESGEVEEAPLKKAGVRFSESHTSVRSSDLQKEPTSTSKENGPVQVPSRVTFSEDVYEEVQEGGTLVKIPGPEPPIKATKATVNTAARSKIYEVFLGMSHLESKSSSSSQGASHGLAYVVGLILVFNFHNMVTVPLTAFNHGGLQFLICCLVIKLLVITPLTYLFLFVGRRMREDPFTSLWSMCPITEGALLIIFILEICKGTQALVDTSNFSCFYLLHLMNKTNYKPNYTEARRSGSFKERASVPIFPPKRPEALSYMSVFAVVCIILLAGLLHYRRAKTWRPAVLVLLAAMVVCITTALGMVRAIRVGGRDGIQWLVSRYEWSYRYYFMRDIVLVSTKMQLVQWAIVGNRSIRDGQSVERLAIWIQCWDIAVPLAMCYTYACGFGIVANELHLPLNPAVLIVANEYPLIGLFEILTKIQSCFLYASFALTLGISCVLSTAYQLAMTVSLVYHYAPFKKSDLAKIICVLTSCIFTLALALLSSTLQTTGLAMFFYHYSAPVGFGLSVSTIVVCACYIFPDMGATMKAYSGGDSPILFYMLKYLVPFCTVVPVMFALVTINVEPIDSTDMTEGERTGPLYAVFWVTVVLWIVIYVQAPLLRGFIKKTPLKELAQPRDAWVDAVAEVTTEK